MAEIKLPESFPATVTMTNLLTKESVDDIVWNTGCSAVGDPHVDEDIANAGKALIEGQDNLLPEIKKAQTAVAVFGLRPQYWILDEGESVTLPVENAEAAVYYADQASESLKVEFTEGEETGTAEAGDAESL